MEFSEKNRVCFEEKENSNFSNKFPDISFQIDNKNVNVSSCDYLYTLKDSENWKCLAIRPSKSKIILGSSFFKGKHLYFDLKESKVFRTNIDYDTHCKKLDEIITKSNELLLNNNGKVYLE